MGDSHTSSSESESKNASENVSAGENLNEDEFIEFIEHIKEGTLTQDLLDTLLEKEPDLFSKRDEFGRFALIFAIESPAMDNDAINKMIRLLLENGADIHQKYRLMTPIAIVDIRNNYNQKLDTLELNKKNAKKLSQASDQKPKLGSQFFITSLAKGLGYNVSDEALCHGYAHMAAQAFLLNDNNDMSDFDQRIKKITLISPEKHVENLAIAREKLKQGIDFEDLTDNEKVAYELPAFIEELILYQSGANYPQLFEEGHRPINQEPEPVLDLVMSNKRDKSGGVQTVTYSTGLYDEDELTTYFSQFQQVNGSYNQSPMAFVLSSSDHSIAITYDPETSLFSVLDINDTQKALKRGHGHRFQSEDPHRIASMARKALYGGQKELKVNDKLVISTTIFTTVHNYEQSKEIVEEWLENTKDINELTRKKIKYKDLNGANLESQAKIAGDVATLRRIYDVRHERKNKVKKIAIASGIGLVVGAAVGVTFATAGGLGPIAGVVATGLVPLLAGASAARNTKFLKTPSTIEGMKVAENRQPNSSTMEDVDYSNELTSSLSSTAMLNQRMEIEEVNFFVIQSSFDGENEQELKDEQEITDEEVLTDDEALTDDEDLTNKQDGSHGVKFH